MEYFKQLKKFTLTHIFIILTFAFLIASYEYLQGNYLLRGEPSVDPILICFFIIIIYEVKNIKIFYRLSLIYQNMLVRTLIGFTPLYFFIFSVTLLFFILKGIAECSV
jgi:hypothetical protein